MKAHILTLLLSLVKATNIDCANNKWKDDFISEAACDTKVKDICEDQSFANLFFYILYIGSVIYLIIDYIRDYRLAKIEKEK